MGCRLHIRVDETTLKVTRTQINNKFILLAKDLIVRYHSRSNIDVDISRCGETVEKRCKLNKVPFRDEFSQLPDWDYLLLRNAGCTESY